MNIGKTMSEKQSDRRDIWFWVKFVSFPVLPAFLISYPAFFRRPSFA